MTPLPNGLFTGHPFRIDGSSSIIIDSFFVITHFFEYLKLKHSVFYYLFTQVRGFLISIYSSSLASFSSSVSSPSSSFFPPNQSVRFHLHQAISPPITARA